VVPGDTGGVSLGLAAFASRQTVTAARRYCWRHAASPTRQRSSRSHVLEAAEHDLEIAGGEVRVVGAPQLCSSSASSRASSRARPGYGFRRRRASLEANVIGARMHSLCQCLPHRRGRGRSRDRRRDDIELCRATGFRHPDQSDDGRRPGGGRGSPTASQRALGMDGLSTTAGSPSPPPFAGLSAAGCHGSAGHREALPADAIAP